MKLTKWAELEGLNIQTVRKWAREGTLPVPSTLTPGGHYLVHDPKYENTVPSTSLKTVGYARVSSSDQKSDLIRQEDRVKAFLVNLGEDAPEVISEVGSGMNGSRSKINRLLSDPTIGTIVVERADRFARMNIQLVKSALEASGRRLVVIDDTEYEDDLVQEVTEFMTSVCARMYGRRSARNKALAAMEAAKNA